MKSCTQIDEEPNFSVFVNWPGAIHEGNGEAVVLIDERADDAQRAAIEELIKGNVGGPWGVLAWTWPKVHAPVSVAYDAVFDGVNTRIKCGEHLEIQAAPIRNLVSGAESHPRVVLPEGIIFKEGDLGTTERFHLSSSIEHDHSGKYMGVASFQYVWP